MSAISDSFFLFLFCLSLALDHQKKWNNNEGLLTCMCLGFKLPLPRQWGYSQKNKTKKNMWLLRVVCLCNSKRVNDVFTVSEVHTVVLQYQLLCITSTLRVFALTFDCSVTRHVTVWRTDHSSWPIPAGCVAVTAALNRVDTFNKTSSLQSLGYYDAFCGNNKNINRKIELN